MGNAFANKKSKEEVYIELNSQSYHGGDIIRGVVKMNIGKPGGYPCDAVNLRIQGAENTQLLILEGSEGNSSTQVYNASSPICTINVPIAAIGGVVCGVLPQGHHEFPFQAKLPPGLPSSLDHTITNAMVGLLGQNTSYCRVEYGVTAAVHHRGNKEPDVFGGTPFNVLWKPPAIVAQPIFVPPYTEPVQLQCCCAPCCPCFTCCCASGMMTLAGSAHEETACNFAIENDSSQRIQELSTEIVETISWNVGISINDLSGNQSLKDTRRATAGRVGVTCIASTTNVLAHGLHDPNIDLSWGTASGRNKSVLKEVAAQNAKRTVIQRLAGGGDGGVTLIIPHSVHDSYDGHHIQVEHYCRWKAKTGSSWMSNPSIGAQVFISNQKSDAPNPCGVGAKQRPRPVQAQPAAAAAHIGQGHGTLSNATYVDMPAAAAAHISQGHGTLSNATYVDMPAAAAASSAASYSKSESSSSDDDWDLDADV